MTTSTAMPANSRNSRPANSPAAEAFRLRASGFSSWFMIAKRDQPHRVSSDSAKDTRAKHLDLRLDLWRVAWWPKAMRPTDVHQTNGRSKAVAKPEARSRVSNGKDLFLDGVDGRSVIARRYRDILAQLTSDISGTLRFERLNEVTWKLTNGEMTNVHFGLLS